VRLLIFADIHANREAFEAVLAHSRGANPDRIVILGDIVGYGADPAWAIDQVARLAEDGAIVLKGNHDDAVSTPPDAMNAAAKAAIDWTRGQLSLAQAGFLSTLPLSAFIEGVHFVHASPARPETWPYITGKREAEQALGATKARVTLCGHVHRPMLYHARPGASVEHFVPIAGVAVPLLPQRRWVCVGGSVGQPRDGVPAAAYSLLDTSSNTLTLQRAPYDIAGTQAKIRAAGLPEALAARLARGS